MIFLQLFLVFSKIGIVNFGGGYAMISLIQAEVVTNYNWISMSEFTDILAISQMTPGPIGVNTATYVGYTAVINSGYSPIMGVFGSILATLSILWLPFTLVLLLSKLLIRYKESYFLKNIFSFLKPIVVGLIASSALSLMTKENFGYTSSQETYHFIISIILFITTFVLVYRYKLNILGVLIGCAVLGLIIY